MSQDYHRSPEDRRRRQRYLRRKKQRRNRRRLFYILCLLLLFLVFTAFRGIRTRLANKSNLEANVALWYYQQMLREDKGQVDRSNVIYLNPLDLANIGRDKLTTFGYDLVKGSNHIKSAEKYAYDTKKIQEIIREKRDYTGKKLVFLTFDDGPNNKITPQILDCLKERGVHATFFLVGNHLTDKHEDVLRRILREGHGIATHSLTHNYKKLYPGRVGNAKQIAYEAKKAEEYLQEYFGPDFSCSVWRYPGGHQSWKGLENGPDQALEKLGATWIDWNCLVGDAQPRSDRPTTSQGQVDYVNKSLHQNKQTKVAVVLAHDADNKQLTADSLDMVIDYFEENGYSFGILK